MLHGDGSLMTENLQSARATDYYICGGTELEQYVPRFTYHGFRYVELDNIFDVELNTIEGLVMESRISKAGNFVCSDSCLNQIFQNILWTQRSNFLELPTDCSQRDERMGWLGDVMVIVGLLLTQT